jgi:hypothetical protein
VSAWRSSGRLRRLAVGLGSQSVVSSWAGAMIRLQQTGGLIVQLRLELAESPAPAVALWELVGEEQRQTAMVLLAALIAQTVAGEQDAEEVLVDE